MSLSRTGLRIFCLFNSKTSANLANKDKFDSNKDMFEVADFVQFTSISTTVRESCTLNTCGEAASLCLNLEERSGKIRLFRIHI